MKNINILISGVGGQGNVLLERIIGLSAIKEGYSVKAADTFGASQRGGSVLSHLRLGSSINSSLVSQGKCHIIVGLEPGEALSAASKFLGQNGLVIVNTSPILPAKVKVGDRAYPSVERILMLLKKLTPNVIELDATLLARQVTGNERATNMVMLGVLIGSGVLPIDPKTARIAIEETTAIFLPESVHAFEVGFEIGKKKQVIGGLVFEDA
jgi:indolepyruvate ferredoxin oxidoreductase beta subunit